mgnify:FL=1
MNVPLNWLAEYVKLPKETKILTDKLTAVGHMLDKIKTVGKETVIDLELRGNRADMFGLIGVAREVAAITDSNLKMPEIPPLPKIDKNCPLLNVQPSAVDLVTRYTAVKLSVKVGPSPKWMVDRLTAYGIPAVNNVVDITNYVMIETSHPLHAFDFNKIKGGQLILRRAKKGEKFATVQQGTTLTLSTEDLVMSDQHTVHGLNIIGGLHSKVTGQTSHIILESAVYNSANCRRTARRLKTITEGGTRHEKHQDPNGVSLSLARAIDLLIQIASARIEGQTSDYYPKPIKPKTIKFDPDEITRLTGLQVPISAVNKILSDLGFTTRNQDIIVPTFRTDIEGSADIVEEIIRVYGYSLIPSIPISDATPIPSTYSSYTVQEKLRDELIKLGLNEIITLSMIANHHASSKSIKLINPPDPDRATLRESLIPNLIEYSQRLLNLNQSRVTLFEIGKVYSLKSKDKYTEKLHLGIAVAGKDISIHNLTGALQKAATLLGVDSLPAKVGEKDNIYWAETDVDKLQISLPPFANPYSVVSIYPPIIEDINVAYAGNYSQLIAKIYKISSLITQIELIDKYENKLTLRLTYHSNSKQLSSQDVSPVRAKLMALKSE